MELEANRKICASFAKGCGADPRGTVVRFFIMKTIVAPIDFSPVTDRVFETATALADSLQCRVVLLHIVAPPPVAINDYGVNAEALEEALAAGEQGAQKQLARYEKRLQLDRLRGSIMLLKGPPVPLILEQCEKLGADLVVMGSHGHGALYNLIVGSTTQGVLRKATCPVIIVPPVHRPQTAVHAA